MHHVYLVAAIGVLVIGTTSFTAQAAQGKAASSSRLVYELGLEDSLSPGPLHGEAFMRARASYAAQKAEKQKSSEAAARFGAWGPELVRAAETYGQDPADLHRVMMCESKGDPLADNGVNKGLFQFDPSTWVGTPFGSRDIYDGQAQIHGAAWMFSQGRKGEWECV